MRELSKGLQQRLGIAGALINNPRLLILDEPFSGLDPLWRKKIRELLKEYNRKGTTLVMSSHILSDVEALCDQVAIMSHGKLKAQCSLDKMRETK